MAARSDVEPLTAILIYAAGEFRVNGPLTDDLAPWARIDQFIGGDTGELVGGDVAQALPLVGSRICTVASSARMSGISPGRPVELHVLPGADMGIALVIVAGNFGHHSHLARSQLAVRHRRRNIGAKRWI
jgi:hypothetical protein